MTNDVKNFSLWCDFIERDFLKKDFKSLIPKILGATSNPSIFANSILNSPAYKAQISSMKGNNPKSIYEALAIEDVKMAASILFPLWQENKDNGYISIEIDPLLGENAGESIDEGKRLFKSIQAPNVMIKVPATEAGYEVMYELHKNNIPVNATLIFSPIQAKNCADAFKNARKNTPSNQSRSVISVFVSRFDRAVEEHLKNTPELQTKLGIYNAIECYNLIEEYDDPLIRTLFASTGVKGDKLPKNYYIDMLYLPHCVNTAPLDSIKAYLDNKESITQIPLDKESVKKGIQAIINAGVDIQNLYKTLLKEGLEAFEKSFEDLLRSI
ncbi:transaldolase [Helicobacter cappadocius]|uniref:Transaldolase n=1 Tax=Helicobacter cappadocius TaxID=3063998 RepID=A0AA90TCH7_9HELI|nr:MULTISPECIES: transaldolase [unclassified Helicobacter]MDO7253748.1 transaldolase [Helicobacter sp. faydin-H75]MDP2539676.1 transaldolase [Helicobacter sp. faydin-H76]